ncbi:MAG: hypothetical protein H6597_01900 [Flavobacteriales bacterium]|nr:hypothetical protein [Flavobacteriales bacterium]MCB9193261.1 hypothetical protein [Flavobacteriales bacterium]
MGLRRFLLRCLLLVAPFLVVLGAVWLVDPYGLFHPDGIVPKELKLKNLYHSGRTMPFSNLMWKLCAFRREPSPNVLLGDSRLSHFDLGHLEEVSGERYFNFGVPGGNYRTIRDVFQWADTLEGLRTVMVQVSFRGLNSGLDWDLVNEPRTLADAPLLYLTNRRVLEATALNLYSWAFPQFVHYDVLPPDQWQRVLEMERTNASEFTPDTAVYGILQHIADRCRTQGARLLLVEYPTHSDVRTIYAEAGLSEERRRYVDHLRHIADFIDLDQPGLFPDDHRFWRDPLHLTTENQRLVIDRVWGDAR